MTHVETHGTGTPLGDPIEVQSVKEVYGQAFVDSDANTCRLGAVKANVGHLESAAGLVGLLKVVLELQNKVIVGQPSLENLNPHIDLGNSRLQIPQQSVLWDTNRRRIAAVSSFGFGGTNAHVLVGESPPVGVAESTDARKSNDESLITLSACDEDALVETAKETFEFVAETNATTAEIVSALHLQKSSHRYRVAASVDSRSDLREKLGAFADERSVTGIQRGAAAPDHPFRAAFLFSGQGGQHIGMGRDLYRRIRVFRQCVEACDELLQDEFGYGVGAVISSDPTTNGAVADVLSGPGSQTSLYVLQLALTRTLHEWGICSTVVLGHSMGEYAAAVTAGVMTWQQGLRLTADRARVIGELPSDGTMAVIFDSADRVRHAIEQQSGKLDIAAIDGPQHIVVSGSATDVNALQQSLRARGTESRLLRIGHAFHSALIHPAVESVGELVGSFDLCSPNQIYVSALTGRKAEDELRSASYWKSHSRQPVQFVRALETLAEQDVDVAIEVGPHPTLCTLAQLNGQAARSFQPTLDRKRNAWVSLLDAVAAAYVRGAEINWERFHESTQTLPTRRVVLPGHPFRRKRFWFDEANDQMHFAGAGGSDTSATETVVGRVNELADGVSESERELLQRADGAAPDVDSLVAKWIESAFATLGIGAKAHQVIEPRRLVATGAIAAKYERFAGRACEILAESGD